MNLPTDVARCVGDGHKECRDCARYLQALYEERWHHPHGVWVMEPQSHPCELRIEGAPATERRKQ